MVDLERKPSEHFTPSRVEIRGYSKYLAAGSALVWLACAVIAGAAWWSALILPLLLIALPHVLKPRALRTDAVFVERDLLIFQRGTRGRRFRLPSTREGWLEFGALEWTANVRVAGGFIADVGAATRKAVVSD